MKPQGMRNDARVRRQRLALTGAGALLFASACASGPDRRSAATDGASTTATTHASTSDGTVNSGSSSGAPNDSSVASTNTSTGQASPAVLVHGHRGDRGANPPGNTLPSFRSALAYGVDVLEGDLQITRDGSVVFGHDDDLRTTGCVWTGTESESPSLLSNMTDAQVALWDCHPELDGVQFPPALHEVVALDTAVGFNLELKRWGTEAADAYLAALIAEDAACGGCLAPRLIVQSFDWAAIQHVHGAFGAAFDVRLSLLAQVVRPDEMEAAAGYADIWSPHQDLVTAQSVAEAHALGFEVAAWTVNDEADMQRVIDAGVDAIITDVPNVLLQLLGR